MTVFTAGYYGYSQWLCQGYTRHKLTLKSLAVPATSASCKLNTCYSSEGAFVWPRRAGLLNK